MFAQQMVLAMSGRGQQNARKRIILTRQILVAGRVVKTGIKLKCRHFYCLSNTTTYAMLRHPSLVCFDSRQSSSLQACERVRQKPSRQTQQTRFFFSSGTLWRGVDQVHLEALIHLIIDQMKVYTINTEVQCLYSDIAPYISWDTGCVEKKTTLHGNESNVSKRERMNLKKKITISTTTMTMMKSAIQSCSNKRPRHNTNDAHGKRRSSDIRKEFNVPP